MGSLTDVSKCKGCGICVPECQINCLEMVDGKARFKEGAPCIECAHCVAICPNGAHSLEGYDPADVLEYKDIDYEIGYDKFSNFVRARRAIRWFKPDAVPQDMIDKVIQVGRFTQTGANMQPLRYVVLTPDTMNKIKEISYKALSEFDMSNFDIHSIRLSPLYAKFQHVWRRWYEIWKETGRDNLLHDAPHQLLVITYYGNEIDASINLGHMEMALNTMGLGGCFTGFSTLAYAISPELKEIIGLQDGETVAISMTFGYPVYKYHRTTNRKPANLTVI